MDIPSKEDWGEIDGDFELKGAFNKFYGKTNESMRDGFYRCVIKRASELRAMPSIPILYDRI